MRVTDEEGAVLGGMPVAEHEEGRSLRASNRNLPPVRGGLEDELGVGEVVVVGVDKSDTHDALHDFQGQLNGEGRRQPGNELPQVHPADRKKRRPFVR